MILGAIVFALAIIHSFLSFKLRRLTWVPLVLSQVEYVFAFWALIFLVLLAFLDTPASAVSYLKSLSFTEALFVFVVMSIASSRPIIFMAEKSIYALAHFFSTHFPMGGRKAFMLATLIAGPLLGSLITEPAAMTVTAIILLEGLFEEAISIRLKYALLALMFVNISLGGTLTHFAATPVVMVARTWEWNSLFMVMHFGYKSVLSIVLSTFVYAQYFNRELQSEMRKKGRSKHQSRAVFCLIHSLFLLSAIYFSHQWPSLLMVFGVYLLFLFITKTKSEYLHMKHAFLVAIFLAGLVILGSIQVWWLRSLLENVPERFLFFGATALTSIMDNAALTYLGSLVNLSSVARYALVAGAVAGGGLTVIANAPNPAGFKILQNKFRNSKNEVGIEHLKLFIWALFPTVIAMICFLFLP